MLLRSVEVRSSERGYRRRRRFSRPAVTPGRSVGCFVGGDKEWDIERTLEANAAALSLMGLLLGRKWRRIDYLPIVVAAFLLQHAIHRWRPPVSIFRRMGVRTMQEIDRERYALKALRGDFENIKPDGDPQQQTLAALNAADYRGRG
jgi:hypothetical protein